MVDIYKLLSNPDLRERVIDSLMWDLEYDKDAFDLAMALEEDHYIFPLSPQQTRLIESVIGAVTARSAGSPFQSTTTRFQDNHRTRTDESIIPLTFAPSEIPEVEKLSPRSQSSLRAKAGPYDETWEQRLISAFERRPAAHDLSSLSGTLLSRILDLRGYTVTGPYLDLLVRAGDLIFNIRHTTVEEECEMRRYLLISFFDSIRVLLKHGQHRLADRLIFFTNIGSISIHMFVDERHLYPLTHIFAYLTSIGKLGGVREMLVQKIIAAFENYYDADKKTRAVARETRETREVESGVTSEDELDEHDFSIIRSIVHFQISTRPIVKEIESHLAPLLDPSEEKWLDNATSLEAYLEGYSERRIRGSGSGNESGAAPQGTPTPAPAGGGAASASAEEITAADYEITEITAASDYDYSIYADDETGEIDGEIDVDAYADDSWALGAAVYTESTPPVAVF